MWPPKQRHRQDFFGRGQQRTRGKVNSRVLLVGALERGPVALSPEKI